MRNKKSIEEEIESAKADIKYHQSEIEKKREEISSLKKEHKGHEKQENTIDKENLNRCRFSLYSTREKVCIELGEMGISKKEACRILGISETTLKLSIIKLERSRRTGKIYSGDDEE